MIGINVTVQVHQNYVQTCVRMYGATGMSHKEYAVFGAKNPAEVLACDTLEKMLAYMQDVDKGLKDEEYDVRAPYIEGFDGWVKISYTFPNPTDLSDFAVTEARYVDGLKGGRDIGGAFKTAFKRAVMINLFNAIASKDVAKMRVVLRALDTAGA